MLNFVEYKILRHRYKQRCQDYQEVSWKLLKAPSYTEKLHYLDYQIENLMRSLHSGQNGDLQKELKRVRTQMILNQIKLSKRDAAVVT